MKKIDQVTYCEYCDRQILVVSPPASSQYEDGMIIIREGSVLLPNRIAETNGDHSHSEDISGYYCNVNCLSDCIKDLLKYPVFRTVQGGKS